MPTYTNNFPDKLILGDVKADGSPDIANILFTFPVPHNRMRVRQDAKIDEIKIPGRSGKVKQAIGYQDSEVEVDITLVDEEGPAGLIKSALEQFSTLQDAFRKRDKDSLPRMFSISSRLTDACRINTVLFKGLEVGEEPGNSDLRVTISLTEFEPIEIQVDRQKLETQAVQQAGEQANAAAEASGAEIGADSEDNQLLKAFRQGKSDAMGGAYDGELPENDPE